MTFRLLNALGIFQLISFHFIWSLNSTWHCFWLSFLKHLLSLLPWHHSLGFPIGSIFWVTSPPWPLNIQTHTHTHMHINMYLYIIYTISMTLNLCLLISPILYTLDPYTQPLIWTSLDYLKLNTSKIKFLIFHPVQTYSSPMVSLSLNGAYFSTSSDQHSYSLALGLLASLS